MTIPPARVLVVSQEGEVQVAVGPLYGDRQTAKVIRILQRLWGNRATVADTRLVDPGAVSAVDLVTPAQVSGPIGPTNDETVNTVDARCDDPNEGSPPRR